VHHLDDRSNITTNTVDSIRNPLTKLILLEDALLTPVGAGGLHGPARGGWEDVPTTIVKS